VSLRYKVVEIGTVTDEEIEIVEEAVGE